MNVMDLRTEAIRLAREAAEKCEQERIERVATRRADSHKQLTRLLAEVLDISDEAAEHYGKMSAEYHDDTLEITIDGLPFSVTGDRYNRSLRVRRTPCQLCGHARYSLPINNLIDLGAWLMEPDRPQHSCPDDAEDWLINQDKRQAEIDAHIKAREAAASKTTRLEKLLAEHPQPWFEDAVCNIVEGVLGLAAIKIQEVAGREF